MHLQLGQQTIDLADRAGIVGVVGDAAALEAAVASRPDVIEVPAGAVGAAAATGIAVAVTVPSTEVDAVLAAGAVVVRCQADEAEVVAGTVADAGASLVVVVDAATDDVAAVGADAVLRALGAGLARDRVALSVMPAQVAEAVAVGVPVEVTVPEGREEALATINGAILAGARLLRTREIAGARRTADVLARLLSARRGRCSS